MLNAIVDSLSDLACSDHEKDTEVEQDDETNTELGKLSEDDELSWVMGTISTMVQHRMESVRQTRMKVDKLTKPG